MWELSHQELSPCNIRGFKMEINAMDAAQIDECWSKGKQTVPNDGVWAGDKSHECNGCAKAVINNFY